MKLKIKSGSTVEVVAGADKGRQGTVLQLDRDRLKIKVQGVAMKTHYSRENGLEKKEGFIDYSNVKLVSAPVAKKTKKKKKA